MEIKRSWNMSVMACVMSWRGAFKRGHEIQSRQGVSLGRQGSQWIDVRVNATDVAGYDVSASDMLGG